ncbi:MAG: hypothetical protein ACLQMH_13635 [Solirubrobacteraceae bacterium]
MALTGCTNPDAPTTSATDAPTVTGTAARSPGEPSAPAPPSAGDQAPSGVQRTPQAELRAFAELYINWNFRTLTTEQRTLAEMSVGAARLTEQQAAASSQADSTISQGHIYNSGQVVEVGPDLAHGGMWIVVTREQTGGDAQYEGLPSTYHVTLARVAPVPGGYAVSEWLPQT